MCLYVRSVKSVYGLWLIKNYKYLEEKFILDWKKKEVLAYYGFQISYACLKQTTSKYCYVQIIFSSALLQSL